MRKHLPYMFALIAIVVLVGCRTRNDGILRNETDVPILVTIYPCEIFTPAQFASFERGSPLRLEPNYAAYPSAEQEEFFAGGRLAMCVGAKTDLANAWISAPITEQGLTAKMNGDQLELVESTRNRTRQTLDFRLVFLAVGLLGISALQLIRLRKSKRATPNNSSEPE